MLLIADKTAQLDFSFNAGIFNEDELIFIIELIYVYEWI